MKILFFLLWCVGIWLAKLTQGNQPIAAADKYTLINIANTCPLAGGKSVYYARAMREYFEPNLHYNDPAICHQANINFRKPRPVKAELLIDGIKLFPNPTNSTTTLQVTATDIDRTITITDFVGRTISQKVLPNHVNNIVLDTQNLQSGVYIVSLSDAKPVQLVIIK